jgi:hypothetical protein
MKVPIGVDLSMANRADARDEAHPVRHQNEEKNGAEKPKRLFDKVSPKDFLEESVKAFHQPLHKVLQTTWDELHLAHSQLRDKDQSKGHPPRHDHGVGEEDGPNAKLHGIRGQAVMLARLGPRRFNVPCCLLPRRRSGHRRLRPARDRSDRDRRSQRHQYQDDSPSVH